MPGEFHGQRSLVGYSLWGLKESNIIEYTFLLLLLKIIVEAYRELTRDWIMHNPVSKQILS